MKARHIEGLKHSLLVAVVVILFLAVLMLKEFDL